MKNYSLTDSFFKLIIASVIWLVIFLYFNFFLGIDIIGAMEIGAMLDVAYYGGNFW